MSVTLFTEPLLERNLPLSEPASRPAEPALPLPAVPFNLATPVREKTRAGRRAARRARLNWEAIAVILLMLVCAAVCVYRLFWAVQ